MNHRFATRLSWHPRTIAMTLAIGAFLYALSATAQMDEAYLGSNWENAQKHTKLVSKEAEAEKIRRAVEAIAGVLDELAKVRSKLDRVGKNLHEKDVHGRKYVKENIDKLLSKLARYQKTTIALRAKMKELKDYSGDLRDFRSAAVEFKRLFHKQWNDYRKHRELLAKMLKQFDDNECRKCR